MTVGQPFRALLRATPGRPGTSGTDPQPGVRNRKVRQQAESVPLGTISKRRVSKVIVGSPLARS
jgi:hypothetical protein